MATVQIDADDAEPCLCQSGRPFQFCCARTGGVPTTAVTAVETRTGIRNNLCYAAGVGDCSPKITREHMISRSALEEWSSGSQIDIGGFTWMETEELRSLPTAALAAKVLCANHNAALSPLDVIDARFVRYFEQTAQVMETALEPASPVRVLINGHDVERWLLKVLCGLIVSGTIEVKGVDPRRWRPPSMWLDVVFGRADLPDGYGMYFHPLVTEEERFDKSVPRFSFAALSNARAGVLGLAADLRVVGLYMAMTRNRGGVLEHARYRPTIFESSNGINQALLLLAWTGRSDGAHVPLIHRDPRDPAPDVRD